MNANLPDLVLIRPRRAHRAGEWRRVWDSWGPLLPICGSLGVVMGTALAILAARGW